VTITFGYMFALSCILEIVILSFVKLQNLVLLLFRISPNPSFSWAWIVNVSCCQKDTSFPHKFGIPFVILFPFPGHTRNTHSVNIPTFLFTNPGVLGLESFVAHSQHFTPNWHTSNSLINPHDSCMNIYNGHNQT